MLSGRYIHLHEALGLGPMWLNAAARVHTGRQPAAPAVPIAAPPRPVSAAQTPISGSRPDTTPKQPQAAPSLTVAPKKAVAPHSARLAALQRVGSSTLETEETAVETAAPVLPAPSTRQWLAQLSGSIPRAQVMVLSVCASPADIAAGRLFSGEDGALLDKMLAAIGLGRHDVYLNTWLKDLPDFNPQPPEQTVADAAQRIAAEFQLSGVRALLLLGQFFEREDVTAQLAAACPDTPYFMIDHPLRLLSRPALKRGAWETLQRLQAALND